jgi:8-oxo-dGTP diphosphatase
VAAPIKAAGAVVWRDVAGQVQVAVIHRPRYDDWTLPKGKLDPEESELAAAVREIREEIGAEVGVSRRLGWVEYPVEGVPKSVAFFCMRYATGRFTPGREVDELVWLSVDDARRRMSHGVYRDILDRFVAMPVPHAVVVLLRHAKAGKRSEWQGEDSNRPLDREGQAQAEYLASTLPYFAVDRIVSADRTRCVLSVTPLAQRLGLQVEVLPAFSDESFMADPEGTVRELLELAKPGSTVVISSQGTAVPGLISRLQIKPAPSSVATRKGSFWVLCCSDPTRTPEMSADYYEVAR